MNHCLSRHFNPYSSNLDCGRLHISRHLSLFYRLIKLGISCEPSASRRYAWYIKLYLICLRYNRIWKCLKTANFWWKLKGWLYMQFVFLLGLWTSSYITASDSLFIKIFLGKVFFLLLLLKVGKLCETLSRLFLKQSDFRTLQLLWAESVSLWRWVCSGLQREFKPVVDT